MSRKKALILINNKAGIGQGHDDTFDIVTQAAKSGYEPLIFPIIPGTKLTSEVLIEEYGSKADVIMCVGGDGTLNHVMNSIMEIKEEDRPPIAYVPSGSTNDFARCLGIPDTRKKAINAAFKGKKFSYDIGKMNDRYFNYVAAFGAFSEISYDTDQGLKNVLGYAAYVINAITRFPKNIGYGIKMTIETGDRSFEGEFLFGAVCNSVSIGGMMLLGNADVKLDDGSMELLLIRSPKNLADINSILTSLATGNPDNPHICLAQADRVSFRSEVPVSWAVDGEYGGDHADTKICVLPRAASIIISK